MLSHTPCYTERILQIFIYSYFILFLYVLEELREIYLNLILAKLIVNKELDSAI